MKINFIYRSFPKGYCWSTQSNKSEERLKENIVKEKQLYVTAELETKTSIYTSISLNEDSFGIGLIPLGCEHLKFLYKRRFNPFGCPQRLPFFKLLKSQGKTEYEFYLTQFLKEYITDIETKIDELTIFITTDIKEWINE